MWIHTPNENPETPKVQSETPKMPNDHPEKQGVFAGISDALRTLSSFLGFGEKNENGENKPNKLQEFFAKIIGIFNGIDIEKGVTVNKIEDIAKIREAFRPIINLDETGIILNEWDFIIFNKDMGTIDIYPFDKNNKTGHSDQMSGTVNVAPRQIPIKTPEQVEEEYKSAISSHTEKPQESNKFSTPIASQLGRWLTQRGAGAKTGPDSCGEAVDVLLTEFGIKKITPGYWRHGNRWHGFLEKDPRFKKIEVNSLSDIPPGAIMTYNWKWRLNGKPNGSAANQKYGHVEIKASNGLYYSFWHGTKNPGGSAREPQLHNNFAKWKEATGFAGAFVPIAKNHEDAIRAKKTLHS